MVGLNADVPGTERCDFFEGHHQVNAEGSRIRCFAHRFGQHTERAVFMLNQVD